MAVTMLHHFLLPRFFFVLFLSHTLVHGSSDADAILAFKSKADPRNRLAQLSARTSSRCCEWAGVECTRRGRVARVVIEGFDLGGVFGSGTLTRLDQLRVLSLQNNSLSGPIPDLSPLVNLKTLFLGRNAFSGSFPPSIALLHRIRTVDLSGNNLSGPIPASLAALDRLYCLRLEWNRFSGPVPPLNQSSLLNFNVSGNELAGAVPVTAAFLRFGRSSFSWNPGLCGEIVNTQCLRSPPFFPAAKPPPPPPPPLTASGGSVLGQSAEQHGFIGVDSSPSKKRGSAAVVLGFSAAALVLVCSVACLVMAARRRRSERKAPPPILAAEEVAAVLRIDELEEKVKRVQVMQVAKSGSLVFCAGEAHGYTLDQLMRGSAELLGRGTVGTTYKAVLDNRSVVTVKRLDAVKMAGAGKEVFERHMEAVGGLRHPNLVPLRAYFHAKEERLLVYDYEPNGSLYSLIHGTKSTKAKPLHWTSCLKIAEDVAQGLSYIHQAWRLAHGNLKSSNVLLGPDFEACVADHCLAALLSDPPPDDEDPDSSAYRAPEARISPSGHRGTPKSDVYAFGVLLLELLTGRAPSRHPGAAAGPEEVAGWVRSARGEEGEGDERLAMMVEVAAACRAASPEQRPTMWQVLKMIQEIKESVLMEESDDVELDQQNGSS